MNSPCFLLKKSPMNRQQVTDAVSALELRPTATPSSRPAVLMACGILVNLGIYDIYDQWIGERGTGCRKATYFRY